MFIRRYSDQELLDYLLKFYEEHKKVPTTRDFKKNKNYPNSQTYSDRFGSWKNALIKAGLYNLRKDKFQFDRKEYSKEEMLELLENYIKTNNKLPTHEDLMKDESMPIGSTYVRKFGSLNKAIELLGYNPKIKRKKYDNNYLINQLKKLYKELGRTPTSRDIDACNYCPYTKVYSERFGNIYNALDRAGIPNYPKSTSLLVFLYQQPA